MKMKHNFKRTLSLLMALVMALSCMSLPAMATGDAAALPEAVEGVITLTQDVALTSTYEISSDLTIDLNGFNITASGARALWVKEGSVEITGEGTISATGAIDPSSSVIRVGDNAGTAAGLTIGKNVTVSSDVCYGVTVFGTETSGQRLDVKGKVIVTGSSSAISGNGTASLTSNEITIYSGAIVTAEADTAIYHPQDGVLTVKGGTITGPTAIEAKGGAVTISGGTITATGEVSHAKNDNGPSTSGYALAAVENAGYKGDGDFTVTGGTFNGPVAILVDAASESIDPTIAISGGTFNGALPDDAYIAEGYTIVNGNKIQSENNVAFKIDDNKYTSLSAALNAVEGTSGKTIKLQKDNQTYTGIFNRFTLDETYDFTFDLGGYEVTMNGAHWTLNGATVTISNGTINVKGNMSQQFTVNSGKLTIAEDAEIKATGAVSPIAAFGPAEIDVYGTLTAEDSFALAGNGSSGNGDYTFNIYEGSELVSTGASAIYHPNAGELNITGGTITGTTAVYQKSGELNITGGELVATGSAADYTYNGNGCNATGDTLVIDNCGYPGGVPVAEITGGTFTSANAKAVGSYAYGDREPVAGFITGGTFSSDPAAYLADGLYSANSGAYYTVSATPASGTATEGNVAAEATEGVTDANGTAYSVAVTESGVSAGNVAVTAPASADAAALNAASVPAENLTDSNVAALVASVVAKAYAETVGDADAKAAAAQSAVEDMDSYEVRSEVKEQGEAGSVKQFLVEPVLVVKDSQNNELGSVELTNEQLSAPVAVTLEEVGTPGGQAKITHYDGDNTTSDVYETFYTDLDVNGNANFTASKFSMYTAESMESYTKVASVTAGGNTVFFDDFAEAAQYAIGNGVDTLTLFEGANNVYTFTDSSKSLTVKVDSDWSNPTVPHVEGKNGSEIIVTTTKDTNNKVTQWKFVQREIATSQTYQIKFGALGTQAIRNGDAESQTINVPVIVTDTNGQQVWVYGVDFFVKVDNRIIGSVSFEAENGSVVYTPSSESISGNYTTYRFTLPNTGWEGTVGTLTFTVSAGAKSYTGVNTALTHYENNAGGGTGYTTIAINGEINTDANDENVTVSGEQTEQIPFQYKLTFAKDDHAAVTQGTVGSSWVAPGTAVTLGGTPDYGYHEETDKWIFSDNADKAVTGATVTAVGSGSTVAFAMPNHDVTVTYDVAPNSYKLVYSNNEGAISGTPTGTMTDKTGLTFESESFGLTANTFTATGYTFKGWSRTENAPLYAAATDIHYADGAAFVVADYLTAVDYANDAWDEESNYAHNTDVQTITLYAVWEENTYTIHFDDNGHKAASDSAMADQVLKYTDVKNLTANTYVSSKGTYAFTGWNTAADGNGTAFADEESFNVSSNLALFDTNRELTLYAQWSGQVKFFGDGLSGVDTDGYIIYNVGYGAALNTVLGDTQKTATQAMESGYTFYRYEVQNQTTNLFEPKTWDEIIAMTMNATSPIMVKVVTNRAYTIVLADDSVQIVDGSVSGTAFANTDADSLNGWTGAYIKDHNTDKYTYEVAVTYDDSGNTVNVTASYDTNSGKISILPEDLYAPTADPVVDVPTGKTLTVKVTKTVANIQVETYSLVNNIVMVRAYSPSNERLSYRGAAMYQDKRVGTDGTVSFSVGGNDYNCDVYVILIDAAKAGYTGSAPAQFAAMLTGENAVADKTDAGAAALVSGALAAIKTDIESNHYVVAYGGTEAVKSVAKDYYDVNKPQKMGDTTYTQKIDVSDLDLVYSAYLNAYGYAASNGTGIVNDRYMQFLLSDVTFAPGNQTLEADKQQINMVDVTKLYEHMN